MKYEPITVEDREGLLSSGIWRAEVRTVEPHAAMEMLGYNAGNRRLRKHLIAKYSKIMRHGSWMLAPLAIIIGKSGRLLDGQHRLHGIIATEKGQPCFIVRNVDDEVFSVIDRGFSRSATDALGIEKKLVETAKCVAHLFDKQVPDYVLHSLSSLLREPHDRLMAGCPSSAKYFSAAPFRAAACMRIATGSDPDHVINTYRDLVLGHVASLPPIAQSIIAAFVSGRIKGNSGAIGRNEAMARAWDVFDPSKAEQSHVRIRDMETRLAQIRDAARKYVGK